MDMRIVVQKLAIQASGVVELTKQHPLMSKLLGLI